MSAAARNLARSPDVHLGVDLPKALAAAAVALTLAGCADDSAAPCTVRGAAWSADVSVAELPGTGVRRLQLELCQADGCERLTTVSPVRSSNYVYLPNIHPETVEGPLSVVATLLGRGGVSLSESSAPTEFETRFPNGTGCDAQTVLRSVAIAL